MHRALISLFAGVALLMGPLCAAGAAPGQVRLSEENCRLLVRHSARSDTAFTPGLDVRGQAVAPADLEGGARIALPESIPIVITVDIAERLGLSLAPDSVEADAFIGVVELRGGEVTFNGQALTPEAERTLAAHCAAASDKDGSS